MNFSSLQPIEAAVTLPVIWIGLGVMGLAIAAAGWLVRDFVAHPANFPGAPARLRDEGRPVDDLRDPGRNSIGHARDDVPTPAVSDQDDVGQVMGLDEPGHGGDDIVQGEAGRVVTVGEAGEGGREDGVTR